MTAHLPRTGIDNSEIATYIAKLKQRFGQIAALSAALSDDELNRAPAVAEGNSVYALAAHTAGNARAWIPGIACGQPMRRHRPAEFASSGDGASVQTLLTETLAEVTAALEALPAERLGQRIMPDGELWGLNEPHEITPRWAILQVIEHASLHLGHMELTRDLLRTGS
jgi:hypothetical protein